MSAIPNDVWRRWALPEFDPLRQAVLVFDGNLRKEAAMEMFTDVSLLYHEGEGITSVKGVFYITTKRMIFLPKDTVYDPMIVEATFNNLKSLTGVRSDLSISIIDRLNAVANFQFASTRSLYQCFNLLRALCEASRKPMEEFQKEIVKLASQTARDETPFSSIEVELEACTVAPEVMEAGVRGDETKADMWSVGVLAIELLMGKQPYWDYGDMVAKLQIRRGNFPEPPANASPEFKQFVGRVLSGDPDKRPTAETLLKDKFLKAVDDKAAAGVIAGLIDACKGVPRKEMKEFEFEYVEEEEEEEAPDEAQEQVEPAAQEQ